MRRLALLLVLFASCEERSPFPVAFECDDEHCQLRDGCWVEGDDVSNFVIRCSDELWEEVE